MMSTNFFPKTELKANFPYLPIPKANSLVLATNPLYNVTTQYPVHFCRVVACTAHESGASAGRSESGRSPSRSASRERAPFRLSLILAGPSLDQLFAVRSGRRIEPGLALRRSGAAEWVLVQVSSPRQDHVGTFPSHAPLSEAAPNGVHGSARGTASEQGGRHRSREANEQETTQGREHTPNTAAKRQMQSLTYFNNTRPLQAAGQPGLTGSQPRAGGLTRARPDRPGPSQAGGGGVSGLQPSRAELLDWGPGQGCEPLKRLGERCVRRRSGRARPTCVTAAPPAGPPAASPTRPGSRRRRYRRCRDRRLLRPARRPARAHPPAQPPAPGQGRQTRCRRRRPAGCDGRRRMWRRGPRWPGCVGGRGPGCRCGPEVRGARPRPLHGRLLAEPEDIRRRRDRIRAKRREGGRARGPSARGAAAAAGARPAAGPRPPPPPRALLVRPAPAPVPRPSCRTPPKAAGPATLSGPRRRKASGNARRAAPGAPHRLRALCPHEPRRTGRAWRVSPHQPGSHQARLTTRGWADG
jgi:hypothetical protein